MLVTEGVPSGGGKTDLADNAMVVDWASSNPTAGANYEVARAYAGGAWTGAGITSAAANSTHFAVGVVDNSQAVNGVPRFGYPSLKGEPVDATSTLVAFTRYGDANLDFLVDGKDLALWQENFNPGVSGYLWWQGDFNYDGFVDDLDYNLWAINGGGGPPILGFSMAALSADALQHVPEPGAAGLLLVGGGLALARRRARR